MFLENDNPACEVRVCELSSAMQTLLENDNPACEVSICELN